MKTYKTKASAKRAMINEMVKKGFDKEVAKKEFEADFELVEKEEGQWWARRIQRDTKMAAPAKAEEVQVEEDFEEGNSRVEVAYTEAGDPISKEDKELLDIFGTVECPHCSAHLSNGVIDIDQEIEDIESGTRVFDSEADKSELLTTLKNTAVKFTCLGCGEDFGPERKIEMLKPRVSTTAKPCNVVWEIAIAMNKEAAEEGKAAPSRKEVIAECVNSGVAYNTARTQYQAWFKANKA